MGLNSRTAATAAGLELRLLRYFIAVAETEHVGRAAAQLHISQSPLSRQIRQLEDLLGVALFARERQRIRLTDAGRWLLGPARELIARGDALVREASELGGGELGRISIGFVGAALTVGVLPVALRQLRVERPRVEIALRQLPSTEQLAALTTGALDLGLVHRRPAGSELELTRLLDQPYALAVPRPGRLARGPIRPAQLDDQPWISVAGGEPASDRAEIWARLGFAPRVVVRVAEWTSALALVDAGLGFALVPASAATETPPGVALRRLPWLKLTSPLWLARRRGRSSPLTSDFARWLIDAAAQAKTKA